MFDDTDVEWAPTRARLRGLLSDDEWAAARRTTLNAHYTDPGVVAAVWEFLSAVGFSGGRVLEPGCGSGNFIGVTPPVVKVSWVGVELDPATAAICSLLYPTADIRAEGFEVTDLLDASVDAVVGNVPFGQVALYDRRHNAAGESIHNHFIIKALHLCRPGGMIAVLTSRYTLDARNPQARATIGGLADLVTAVRLPGATHRQVAGTDVVTDLIVLHRRPPGAEPADAGAWRRTATLDTIDGPVPVNEWFVDHPELILGEPALGGPYRPDDLRIKGNLDPARLRTVLAAEAAAATARGHRHDPLELATVPRPAVDTTVDVTGRKPGSIVALTETTFGRVTAVGVEPFDCPANAAGELRQLCGLRDVLSELLDVQAATVADDRLTALQRELTVRYDTYTARFGPLNRYTWGRTGRTDTDSGTEVMRRLRPRMGGFRDDPDAPSVFALEEFDPATQQAHKAAVFSQRVLAPRPVRHGADNAVDAILVCLDQRGRVELSHVADLLGVDGPTARSELAQLVFDDPTDRERLVPAAAYLSGDVRAKRVAAAAAAADDDRYRVNVDALDTVLPIDLTPAEIDVRPGQSWIPVDVVGEFIHDVLGVAHPHVVHDPYTATWELDVPHWQRSTVTMTSEWGTDRKDAVSLLQSACNNSPVVVYDEVDDRRIQNQQATLDAREKQEQLLARFSSWTWDDPARTKQLVEIYNQRFNNHVSRSYDGAHLSLPGLATTFTPRDHQRAAVARILAEPSTLLAHEVGAGKTAVL